MLISIDILSLKGFIINLLKQLITIISCQNMEIFILIQSLTYN